MESELQYVRALREHMKRTTFEQQQMACEMRLVEEAGQAEAQRHRELLEQGILYDRATRRPAPAPQTRVTLDAWLSEPPPPPPPSGPIAAATTAIEGLPSALGRAVIPSPVTPSQILETHARTSGQVEPARSSDPYSGGPPSDEPISLNRATQEPRLVVRRVASVIAPAPDSDEQSGTS